MVAESRESLAMSVDFAEAALERALAAPSADLSTALEAALRRRRRDLFTIVGLGLATPGV